MTKLYSRVVVAALAPLPLIRLQFLDDKFGEEPASHADAVIPSDTAEAMIELLQKVLAVQKTGAPSQVLTARQAVDHQPV